MGKLEHPFKKCVKFYTLVVEEHRRQALVVIMYDYIAPVNFMHFMSPPHASDIAMGSVDIRSLLPRGLTQCSRR
jgi:hypothetical protein